MVERSGSQVAKNRDEVERPTVVVGCAGIGKIMGTIAAESVRSLVNTKGLQTVCLPLVIMDDEETLERLRRSDCVVVEGCQESCVSEILASKGITAMARMEVLQFWSENVELRPKSILELGEDGIKLRDILVERIMTEIGKIRGKAG